MRRCSVVGVALLACFLGATTSFASPLVSIQNATEATNETTSKTQSQLEDNVTLGSDIIFEAGNLELDDLSRFRFNRTHLATRVHGAESKLFRRWTIRNKTAGCAELQDLADILSEVVPDTPQMRKLSVLAALIQSTPEAAVKNANDIHPSTSSGHGLETANETANATATDASHRSSHAPHLKPPATHSTTAPTNTASEAAIDTTDSTTLDTPDASHPPEGVHNTPDTSNPTSRHLQHTSDPADMVDQHPASAQSAAAPPAAQPDAGAAAEEQDHLLAAAEAADLSDNPYDNSGNRYRATDATHSDHASASTNSSNADTTDAVRPNSSSTGDSAEETDADGTAAAHPATTTSPSTSSTDPQPDGTESASSSSSTADADADPAINQHNANATDAPPSNANTVDASAAVPSNGSTNATSTVNSTDGLSPVRRVRVGDQSVITGLEAPAAALFDLAVLASTGIAEPHKKRDPLWAHLALHRAAAFNSYEAQAALADRYFFGRGMPADCEAGLRYAKLAARTILALTEKDNSHLDPWAPVRLRERWMKADYITEDELHNNRAVVAMEEDLALRGDPNAQRRVAYRRLVGQGVDVDQAAAYDHFQAAAQQGDPYALFNLGYMHLQGLHVPSNATKAKEYFSSAADKNLGAAFNGLGVLYYNGQGVERNLTMAQEYFEAGAKLNNSDCLFNLANLYQTVEGNVTKAIQALEQAHALGHWRAGYNLAQMHSNTGLLEGGCRAARGYILEFLAGKKAWQQEMRYAVRSYDIGDYWGALIRYLRLAEQGCEPAAANAAWMLLQRKGMDGPEGAKLAVRMLKRGGSYNTTGSAGSMVQLGNLCLEAGEKLEPQACGAQDAAEFFRRAAASHSVEAMMNLAWLYWHGIGLEANVSAAADWYKRAYMASNVMQDGFGPLVALWGFWVGHVVSRVVGWGALRQLWGLLLMLHNQVAQLAAGGVELVVGAADGKLEVVDKVLEQVDPDLIMIVCLGGALAGVLWVRQQQQRERLQGLQRGPRGNEPPLPPSDHFPQPPPSAQVPQQAGHSQPQPAGQHVTPDIPGGPAGGVEMQG